MISGPLLLLVLPLAMGGIVYLLMRWKMLAALLSCATAVFLGVAVLTFPLEQPFRIWGGREIDLGETVVFFGRELVLQSADRMAMAIMFLTSAAIFLLAWRVSTSSLVFPIGLGLLSVLSGALLIRPLIYAALLIEIAAVLSVFALQSEDRGPSQGGLRYLTFVTLALPGLLVTHWLLERYTLTPNETGLLSAATALLAVSFALLLGVVPFHTWVPAVSADSVPLASVFVLSVSNTAIWFLLLDFLETYPWLSSYPQFDAVIRLAGLAMVVLGGGLSAAQKRLGPLIGYGALVDSGAALLALSLHNNLGLALVFMSLLMRPFGLLLMAVGLSGLYTTAEDDRLDFLFGLGWRVPWSVAALVAGGLSLAGLPISAGFTWRWALYRALAEPLPSVVLALLLAAGGVMVGVWRGLAALLSRSEAPEPSDAPPWASSRNWLTPGIVALAVLSSLIVGLFPQLLAPLAIRLAEAYTFLMP